jgi:hypothetical protein
MGKVETFEGPKAPTSGRLTDFESEDLRYLWQSYGADLGMRSAHGLVEQALLMLAPPRDVQKTVLEELARHGGRAPEGRIVRLIVLEGLATAHEVRLAIAYLGRPGRKGPRVERVEVPQPEVHENPKERSYQEQARLDEWTGWDLQLTERGAVRMKLALDGAPKEWRDPRELAWRAHDEALERFWHVIPVGQSRGGGARSHEEMLGSRQRRSANRALVALAQMTQRDCHVLQCVYGRAHGTDEAEVEAVRAIVGGSRDDAEAAIVTASAAYRAARRTVRESRKRAAMKRAA